MPLYNFCKKLGERIKIIRKKRKKTQKTLAGDSECDERSIQRIESGVQATTLQTLEKIAQALDIDIEMLICVSDEPIN